MASIPGAQFNITGASGSQGLLSPRNGYIVYVLPRGGHASQDSTGTLITFDSASIASRFTADQWIQVGLSTDNLRKILAVGGNSLSVQGSAITVAENARVFLIGNTQPSVSGGSATYTIPQTTIRQRGDDAADIYTNSRVTSNADGLIQFWGEPAFYDVIIQDGNQSNQGSIIDLPVGTVEGISTSSWSFFGSTVTMHAALGVTGHAVMGSTLTVGGAIGVTGWATFGQTATFNAAIGVTGWATFGSTATFNAAIGVTGWATFGVSVTVAGALGVTGTLAVGASGVIGGLSVSTGIFGVSNQPRAWLVNSSDQNITPATTTYLTWDTELFDVGGLHSGSSSSINITNPGFYFFIGQVQWAAIVGTTTADTVFYTTTIRKNSSATYEVGEIHTILGVTGIGPKQSVSGMDLAAAGDFYQISVLHATGTTQAVVCTAGRLNSQFLAVKLF